MTEEAITSPAATRRPYVFRGEGNGVLQRLSWNAGRLISRILSLLMFRLHASGQMHLPRQGGLLMVTNHQSFLDPWLIGIALPRQLHYMARDTLFKGGFLQFLGELWNAFPVRRGASDLAAIRTAAQRLNAGFIVNVFPEGTRSEDGTIGSVAPGISLILNRCESEIPIMPVVIDGAYEAWPRGVRFPKPHVIRIEYGRPIPATEWRALSPQDLAKRIRHELIQLQEKLHSSHADASRRRFEEEMSKEAQEPAKPRRRGR